MSIKPSEALRFLGGLVVAAVLGALVVLRVTSCAPMPPPAPPPPAASPMAAVPPAPPPPQQPATARAPCDGAGWRAAAQANAASVATLAWSPFGRPEKGWAIYAPLIAREAGTACAPDTPGFAGALAVWQAGQRLPVTGILTDAVFARLKTIVQLRRPFVRLSATGVCPPPPTALKSSRPGEGYGGKPIQLRPAAFAAWRRMAAAARAADAGVRADPRYLTIFSGFRSPQADAARCASEHNCDAIVRASCSAHRTGLAMDLYVGQAPGYGPDSSADPNRLAMTRTPAYRWLVANAAGFGFVNYPFEPWHWEWTGEAP